MKTELDTLFDELFPICRSIAGKGLRESLRIMQQHMPLEIKSVPTGTQVFDWNVPQEWKLNHATLTGPDGTVLLDSNDTNLHVLNFSIPFEGDVELAELQTHLHSIPDLPDAIPYVTSYYVERWGLCLTEKQRATLREGTYHVKIDTEKRNGELNYATCDLPGETSQTILLTSYLCHPSLANNELSGPLALLGVYEKLKALKKRRYRYKFVLLSETIGSISFLAQEGADLAPNLVGGMVLTCLGGAMKELSFKLSRSDWLNNPSRIDCLARRIAKTDPSHFAIRPFTPEGGSDERQFCSPGVNWPVIQAAKTVYGQYEEYHTSLDTKELMTIEAVENSVDQIFSFLQVFELSDQKLASNIEGGEPQLGKRDLYPTLNGPMTNKMSADNTTDQRYVLNLLLNVLSLADGTFSIQDIAEKVGCPVLDLLPILTTLVDQDVISITEDSPK